MQQIEKMKIEEMNFEEALGHLEALVKKLECDDVALDNFIKFYEQANALKLHCQTKLNAAKLRIEKVNPEKQTLESVADVHND